ncbi:MAG TPA: S8 family serine peptidase, partial [Burkholderiaceae bacterium]|nr:S8 family serine peptidase [Burkholderiaceae bacterium]
MIRQVIIVTVSTLSFLLVGGASAATVVKGSGKGKPIAGPTAQARAPKFVDGQVLVGFLPGAAGQARSEAHRQVGGRLIRTLRQLDVDVVAVAAGAVPSSIDAYRQNPNVRFAEPNHVRRLTLPNEGSEPWPYGSPPSSINFMTEQWGLHNTGQPLFYDQFTGELGALKGAPDADIDFSEVWDRLTGQAIDQGIVIAVLDSGVDCTHEDLNGKCIIQQNFGPSTYGQADVIGHGTHVAATAAAKTNNALGTAGVGWNAKVADLKVCYEEIDYFFGIVYGYCNDADIAAGLTFAADQGHHIASMSLAGPEQGSTLSAAVDYAVARGVLIIAGAGNAYTQDPMYPAAYPSVMAVGATDYFDNLASFSSFGKTWVHILAPGVNILSALSVEACGTANCYGWNSGTSMATPHVSGAAALVWGRMKALGRP